jgi:hypothetical protein
VTTRAALSLALVAAGLAGAFAAGTRPLDASASRSLTHRAGLSPDSINGMAGQLHTVALKVDLGNTGKDLSSYAVTITWDSMVVRLDSVRGGNFGAPTVNYARGNEVRFGRAGTTGLTGDLTLANLYFRMVNDTIGRRTPIAVVFSDLVASDFTDLRTDLQTVSGVARVLPAAVVVRFSPDSTHERVNGRPLIDLTADLSAAPTVLLGSYAMLFTWDSTVMRFDSLRAGDFALPQYNQLDGASLRLTAADGTGRGGAPFSLAKLYFTFLGDAYPRVSPLATSVTEMHAARTFANLLPGVTAAPGKAVIGGVYRGDIDVNGAIAALDAQLILQGVVGLALPAGITGVPHGDADCGGSLQAKDAQIVLNQVVGNAVSQFCVARIQ